MSKDGNLLLALTSNSPLLFVSCICIYICTYLTNNLYSYFDVLSLLKKIQLGLGIDGIPGKCSVGSGKSWQGASLARNQLRTARLTHSQKILTNIRITF